MNNQSHAWYPIISKFRGDMSVVDVKRECKLRYGIPILRADNQEFGDRYDSLIKYDFSYEQKLEMMDLISVTSLMSNKQIVAYCDEIQRVYAEQGLQLVYGHKHGE